MGKFGFAPPLATRALRSPISDLIRHRHAFELRLLKADEAHGGSTLIPPIDNPNGNTLPPFTEREINDPQLLKSAAAEMYRMRRARDRLLPADLAGEPGWDILLALYAEGPGEMTVSSVCRGASVPTATAMRWVAALDGRGLVERLQHARDPRLILCSLTDEGRLIVERCLKAMLRSARS